MHGTIIAIAGFAATLAGTLGGVYIGQRMSRSSQREQWLLDTTKQEYRELLSAFSTAYMALQQLHEPGSVSSEQDQRQCSVLELDSYRVLGDRLFIAKALESEGILRRWAEALVNFKDTKDRRKFADRFSSIRDTIVWLATDKKDARPTPV